MDQLRVLLYLQKGDKKMAFNRHPNRRVATWEILVTLLQPFIFHELIPATPVPNGVDFNSAVFQRAPDTPEYFDVFEYPSTGIFDVFDYPNTDVFDVFDYPSDLHPENLDSTVCNFVSRIPH